MNEFDPTTYTGSSKVDFLCVFVSAFTAAVAWDLFGLISTNTVFVAIGTLAVGFKSMMILVTLSDIYHRRYSDSRGAA